MYYTCIACITIDSVMNINKKNHPQVYLEECKYRIKKIKIPKFIKTELKSDSDSEKIDSELMLKLESGSHSELLILFFLVVIQMRLLGQF